MEHKEFKVQQVHKETPDHKVLKVQQETKALKEVKEI
tara:strand:+ start:71 stop:181 length:111 start_codon:yes stop_codon:yes gene_type:complete